MFERFTDRARRVVVLAQEEARGLNHDYIGTEHLLLGLMREGKGVAARALDGLGVRVDAVAERVEAAAGRGSEAPSGHIPFTPRSKKVLELSLREALDLGHDYIGTEHILLGLLREGEGVAAQVLDGLGVTADGAREQVTTLLRGARVESRVRIAGTPAQLQEIAGQLAAMAARLDEISGRLAAVERHLAAGGSAAASGKDPEAGPGDGAEAAPGDGPKAGPGDGPKAGPGDGSPGAAAGE
jgi:ATP-dependent Clp protease ATP-binding subunit ClpC